MSLYFHFFDKWIQAGKNSIHKILCDFENLRKFREYPQAYKLINEFFCEFISVIGFIVEIKFWS